MPVLTRCFWATRVAALVLYVVLEGRISSVPGLPISQPFPPHQDAALVEASFPLSWLSKAEKAEYPRAEPWYQESWLDLKHGVEYVLARSCENLVAASGMTSAIAALGSAIGTWAHVPQSPISHQHPMR